MALEIPEFWRLVIDSQLLPPHECQRLGQQFAYVKGAAVQGNARTLAEWLIAQNVISRYQSTILLAGRAGPFAYGDYKIYDRLEDGPLRGQFKAVHAPTGHPVVLRFFAGEAVGDAHRWAETAQRAIKQTEFSHPHLWRTFELADLQQFKFVSVEDVPGQTAAQRLAASQRIPFQEACRIAYQTALALSRMHESGFIHGDVRPETIVLAAQNRAVLWCDASRRLVPDRNNLQDPELLERANYFAPELATAGKSPDALTDIYALGCTLYQMLAGEQPFAGGDFQHKMHRHANEAIQPLAPFGVPEPLAKVVAYMMAKNSTVRYQQASQAAEQLGQFLEASDRQPKAASAPPTLAALEQFLASKPKPTISYTSSPAPASGPVVATGNSAAVSPVNGSAHGAGVSAAAAAMPTITTAAASTTGSKISSPLPTSSASERFKQKKPLSQNKPLLVLLACGFAFLLTMGVLYASGVFNAGNDDVVAENNNGDEEDGGASTITNNNGDTGSGSDNTGDDEQTASEETRRFTVLTNDDGQMLWAPPTDGEPVDLTFVPPLAKVYLVARPSDILGSVNGAAAMRTLGPDFAALRQRWEQSAGVKLDEVERLVIGIHPNDSQMPRFSSTVFLKNRTDMQARWGDPAAAANNTFNVKGQTAWIPPAGDDRVFVLGPTEEINALAESSIDRPKPSLDRYFKSLIDSSDGKMQFVALFDPQFFHTDGRDMFVGPYEKLIEPLEEFFGDSAKGMLSLNFGSDFYGELRLYASLEKPPTELEKEFSGKLKEVSQQLKEYIRSLNPPDYWRPLWFEFPNMLSFALRETRISAEGDQAVINVALPGYAAPIFINASELAIATAPGATYNSGGTTTTKKSPQTLDELLAANVDLGFAQQSLEFSMRDLVAAAKEEYPDLPFDLQIKILGADLQKEGITRNRQIRDFNAKDVPLGEVLTQLVRKANPVTTVQSPSEVDQKLVWLVGPDPDNPSKKIVLITTRAAAAEKKLTLPAVFRPQ